MVSVWDDIKSIKGYLAGVVAFATAIGAFLVTTLHLPSDVTILTVAGLAVAMGVIGFLVARSENRQSTALREHEHASQEQVEALKSTLTTLADITLENQRSSLRTEMNMAIHFNPDNHDTIIKMAQRYFGELQGDWVETDLFLAWVDEEEKAGRPVHVPPQLLTTVNTLKANE